MKVGQYKEKDETEKLEKEKQELEEKAKAESIKIGQRYVLLSLFTQRL